MAEFTISTDKPRSGPFDADQTYIQFVLSTVALRYQSMYGTATLDEGITAAREAYNASLPQGNITVDSRGNINFDP